MKYDFETVDNFEDIFTFDYSDDASSVLLLEISYDRRDRRVSSRYMRPITGDLETGQSIIIIKYPGSFANNVIVVYDTGKPARWNIHALAVFAKIMDMEDDRIRDILSAHLEDIKKIFKSDIDKIVKDIRHEMDKFDDTEFRIMMVRLTYEWIPETECDRCYREHGYRCHISSKNTYTACSSHTRFSV